MNIKELFKSPTSLYRGKPFWAWNGRLEEGELRRQIRVFKAMGLGGGFMHSRVGLATPYLSKEWFKLINACADEAQKNNMEAWLYDEDRWPSGAAGGLVTKDPKYRERHLRLTIADPKEFKPNGDELGIFIGKIEGNVATDVRKGNPADAKDSEKVLVFRCVLSDTSPWYNDQTYLDTLSKEAVAKFIEVTHDAYAKNSSKYFGKEIPGIFTDEPNYGGFGLGPNGGHSQWTDTLPEIFKDRYGYDILDHLPEIFFKMGDADFSKVRRDFRDCLTYMFTYHFGKQIYDWCEKYNLLFTGHVLAEENLHSQTSVVGSAMRFYEFMQAPGIDILCGQILTRQGGRPPEYSTAKQCSSMLDQFGRKWMLSELYGCTGWQFTFAEHKAVGDWQAALGVNLRCQHLSWYTMLGEAKRDYPASISFQSPWWRDYPIVENYFSRVNVMMTQGKAVRSVAVIHPIESAWGIFYGGVREPMGQLNNQFMTVQNILLEEHFDFDYVDEDILARYGKIDGNELAVAKAKYKVVVVPPTLTIRESTRKMLADFLKAGGSVIFVEPIAEFVDAVPSDGAKKLAEKAVQVPMEREAIVDTLSKVKDIVRVSIKTEDGKEFNPSLYMLRYDEDKKNYYLFVCHTKQDNPSGKLTIKMPGSGQVQEWDAQTGEVFLADTEMTDDGVLIHTDLPGCGSRIFVVSSEADPELKPRKKYAEIRREVFGPDKWKIMRDEPNAFPLDVAEYSINGGEWQGPLEILKLDRAVRDAAGLRHRGGAMVQPWAQVAPPEEKPLPIALKYHFEVESLPKGPCHLVIEEPERYKIYLNGYELMADENEGWWIDNSFVRIRVLPWFLKKGKNELVLKTNYVSTSNLEAMYFTGEFGFKWNETTPVITELPTELSLGNWVDQGFACYSGSMTYITEIEPTVKKGERLFLELPKWDAVLVKVRLNGKPAGVIAWQPYEVDITDFVQAGKNMLEIEVVSSRRNLLGPLHLTDVYPAWTGPGEFVSGGDRWTDKYVSVPYGLMEKPILSWRQ
ncbi:MAG: glycosyl hydrolase [Candidatus Poribacteria bacterium]